jgi:hypothetical protein
MLTTVNKQVSGPSYYLLRPEITTYSPRMSFETSFDSKQPKLEPKLVSALSKTKRLFHSVVSVLFPQTESFDISIEPKQTEDQPNSLIESIFWYFSEILGLFRFVSKQFCLFQLFRYRFATSKQTETNQNL